LQDIKYTVNKLILSKDKSLSEQENNVNESQYANISLKYNNFIENDTKKVNFLIFPDKINEFIHDLEKA
jgi:hypothetical protein